jgi:sulfatase maturation enzyme AslB (radical SAM superfamily)
MRCPGFEGHYVKINGNKDGYVFRPCCNINKHVMPIFTNYESMVNSQWISECRELMAQEIWPEGCGKCKHDETVLADIDGNRSPRQELLLIDAQQSIPNYLLANVTVSNECNAACHMCGPGLSTRIGRLHGRESIPITCVNEYNALPRDRITSMILTGGEVSFSKEATAIISDLPPNLSKLTIITNGSRQMHELLPLMDKDIDIDIVISVDGVSKVFEYSRWPLKWDVVVKTIKWYRSLYPKINSSLNVTVTAYNILDIEHIIEFAKAVGITIKWSMVNNPKEMDVRYENVLTLKARDKFAATNDEVIKQLMQQVAIYGNNQIELDAFISKQDALRKINISDYLDYSY